MPTRISYAAHGDGLGRATTMFRANASARPLDTPVPTCPGWNLADLTVHLGAVHRWAMAALSGKDGDFESYKANGRAAEDVLDWFDAGATELLQVLADAPEDLDVPFFLSDAPPPREGWARRQSHESTIHAIDAMAARLGRVPTAAETGIGRDQALDGLDELLFGFIDQGPLTLGQEQPLTIAIIPSDAVEPFLLTVVEGQPASARVATEELARDADATIAGTAAQLYLGLWNRGEELTESGGYELIPRWRDTMRIG